MTRGQHKLPAAPDTADTGHRAWFTLAILLSLYALAYLDRQVLTLLVDPIKSDLGISDVQYGLLQGGAFVLFFTLCSLPIGWAVDRYPRRRIIFWGVLIWSLATLASGTARRFRHLLLARFGVGAGEASLAPSSYSLLGDLFVPSKLAGALALFSSGSIVGGAISLALGGTIVSLASGIHSLPLMGPIHPWQLVFVIVGIPGVLMAPLALLVPEPKRRHKPSVDSGTMRHFFAHLARYKGFYACHIGGFSLLNMMGAGYVAWIPTVFIRSHGWTAGRTGLSLGIVTLVLGICGMLFSGHFVDYLFRRGMHDAHLRYYAFAALILGGCGASIGFGAQGTTALLAITAVVYFILPFIAVAAASLQIPTPPELRGRTSALFLFAYNIVGFGMAPPLVALVARYWSGNDIARALGLTFVIIAPLAALTFGLGLRLMRRAVAEQSITPPSSALGKAQSHDQ